MSWRESMASSVGPGILAGISVGDWLRLLAANGFAVDWRYWPRAATISWGAGLNSLAGSYERMRYGRAIREAVPRQPLFILGIWRSGTTHLHNLLARDRRWACPTTFDCLYPHICLTTGWFMVPYLDSVVPRRRPMDNVAVGMNEPYEDEFALACLTQMSFSLSWVFPRRIEFYDRFLTLADCTAEEITRWKETLVWFVQKLTYKYGRPLVLKSPPHTARIRLLLEMFPDAKFVHIHRHPYEVFRSACHLSRRVPPWLTLQRLELAEVEGRVIRQYQEVFDAYFEQRGLIPEGRLCEVRFEDLERDPIGQLRALYTTLKLGDFLEAEPAVRTYLESIASYQKNRLPEIEPQWREEINRRWGRCFEEWTYEKQ